MVLPKEVKTQVIRINKKRPEPNKIDAACNILRSGGLVAFPTETVYGLAAVYDNKEAIDKLYKVKRRPRNKPLTVHISKVDDIEAFECNIPFLIGKLIDKFWPGPLTIVLGLKKKKGTLAFRLPENPIAKELIDRTGRPIVAPSANISGRRAPRSARDVLKELDGKIEAVLDGGKTKIGTASTIIDATNFPYKILRKGAISQNDISGICSKGL